MREWESPYNPFNSAKVLIWREWLEAATLGIYKPPITVAIDPTSRCNLDCVWCNAYDVRQNKNDLSLDHLLQLADMLRDWGVKSTCIAGGGEPMLNEALNDFLYTCKGHKISNSLITNGTVFKDDNFNAISDTCRWIGFSMDSGTNDTFKKVKNITNDKTFDIVVNNIQKLRKTIDDNKSICEIGYKFLLHPYNSHEIYTACMLARSIGVHDFQVRPVGFENITLAKGKDKLEWNYDFINTQLAQCFNLQTKDFRVYGIRHKYANDFSRKIEYSKCRAAPLHPAFCADGKVHTCIDMRGRKDLILCDHFNIIEFWNSKEHKEIMDNINVNNCTKCTFAGYNEIIEKVFIQDNMCRNHI